MKKLERLNRQISELDLLIDKGLDTLKLKNTNVNMIKTFPSGGFLFTVKLSDIKDSWLPKDIISERTANLEILFAFLKDMRDKAGYKMLHTYIQNVLKRGCYKTFLSRYKPSVFLTKEQRGFEKHYCLSVQTTPLTKRELETFKEFCELL